MVLVMEVPNAFWGVTVNEGKRYTQKLTGSIHVSMAALEPGSNKDGPVSVMIQHNKADFMLCSLSSEKVFQQTLDLNFNEGEEVTFYLKGKGVVHMTGYMMAGDQYDSGSDLDFDPENSFAASDDSSSSDEDGGGDMPAGGSKKRKKQMLDKKSKKAKVEIVDDDEDDDDDENHSDTDDDEDDDDDEEETPKKKKSDKQKLEKSTKHQSSPKSQSNKDKIDKQSQKVAAESTSVSKEQETGEKKKRKRNKKKKKSENSTQASDGSPSNDAKGPSKKPSSKVVEGVVVEDLKVGHGPEAKNGSTVHVYYTGRLANGKLFDSKNAGKPAKFRLGKKEIIKGWDVGLQGMKVGGRRKLVIPPNMGYGSQNVGGIPSNSTLQFEVELKAVN